LIYRYFVCVFWYIVWFIAIPIALAWQIIVFLDRVNIIGEFEIWYTLLFGAFIAIIVYYTARNKLPFWQDKDENSSFNKYRRFKDAMRQHSIVEKIVIKNNKKITDKGRDELQSSLNGLKKAIASKNDSQIIESVKKLNEQTERYLVFAKRSASREYVESIGVAVLVAVVLRLFVVEAFKIPSESMVPTLMVGDHIFVSKYKYGLSLPFSNTRLINFGKPKYGEVIVFVKPSIEEQNGFNDGYIEDSEMVGKNFIKRIIGLPGDRIEMKDDIVYINGKKLPRCYVGTKSYRTHNPYTGKWEDGEAELWVEKHGDYRYTIAERKDGIKNNFGPEIVAENQVFVFGDNRDNSNDSRYWKGVPFDNIKGRAMFIWWSNIKPHGFQMDRVGTSIMSEPELLAKQQEALDGCSNMR